MSTREQPNPSPDLARDIAGLRLPLAMTRIGLLAERLWRSFWPLVACVFASFGLLALGVQDLMSIELVWSLTVVAVLGSLAAMAWGVLRFQWPTRAEARARLDSTLPGRPISTLLDRQASGQNDPASAALWQAHLARMAAQAAQAQAPAPNLRLARRDPYGLRFVALLTLVVGLMFGSFWRAASMGEMMPGRESAGLTGPTWEGWVTPPRYTGLPTLYLADLTADSLQIPVNSQVILRFYGQVGDLTLVETVSGEARDVASASQVDQNFEVRQAGEIKIEGAGGRSWRVDLLADMPPQVTVLEGPELSSDGTTLVPYRALDDYAVTGGRVTIALDLEAVPQAHGLATPADPRAPMELDLPLALTGDRGEFTDALIEDFSDHPWANLPVIYSFVAEDANGQMSEPALLRAPLVTRRFFDPVAAALIEQRRDLLWARANGPRIAQILRAVSHRPQDILPDSGEYLQLRGILMRLETYVEDAPISPPHQEEIAAALWDLALQLEEGDVGDALERMRQAQERLNQAMRDGASDEEIARLMQELRDATQEYLRQLSRQAQSDQDDSDGEQSSGDAMQLSQSDLQAMMDRIQELMEQGRMAEAEQALREFQQMMENMQVTQGQPGQGGSPGQQAMDGLAETLRDQQGLSDQAFRDLQEQFNPNARAGEAQGNEGRNGGQGRGQSHEGGQSGSGSGSGPSGGQDRADGAQPGGEGSQGQGGGPEGLAQQQQALRDQLQRQRDGLPLTGSEGDAAREALERADRAMRGAEGALRDGDYAEAIDQQSDAMEALRDGMRAIGEAMAEQQQQGQPGDTPGQSNRQGNALDPLGRERGGTGADYFGDNSLQDGQARRRAWDLQEEIRRRAGERERDETERNYLQRLLDRF